MNPFKTKTNRYIFAAVLLSLIFTVDYYYNVNKGRIRTDFHYHYLASRAMMNGMDIYNRKLVGKKFKYFPVNAVLFMPFASSNPYASESLWLIVQLVMTFTIFKTVREFFDEGLGTWWILPILCVGDIFWDNIKLGQINLPVFFFTVMGLNAFMNDKEFKSGLYIGLASVLKFMPFVFVVYFAFKREWKVVRGAILAAVVLIFIVPMCAIGPKYASKLNAKYFKEGSNRIERMTGTKRAYGQSMAVFVFSLLHPVDKAPEKHKPITINLINLNKGIAQKIAIFFCALLFAIAFYELSRGPKVGKQHWTWEFSIIFTLMLLISPEARKAHFLTLYIPFCSLISFLRMNKEKLWLKWLTILCYALLILRHKAFLGKEAQAYFFAYSSMGISTLILFFTLLYLYRYILYNRSRAINRCREALK